MAALVVKVGALALKTLAKPLASRFQEWAMSHPVARKHIINAAQVLHKWEVYITRGAEGRSGKAFVGAMTEEKSVELASKLASEGFIFAVGVAIVAFEVERQRRKDVAKKKAEEVHQQKILEQARQERERLTRENEEQQELIQRLHHRVEKLEHIIQQIEQKTAEQAQKQPTRSWGGFFSPRGLL